jgi:hypothetical protein
MRCDSANDPPMANAAGPGPAWLGPRSSTPPRACATQPRSSHRGLGIADDAFDGADVGDGDINSDGFRHHPELV